jgi:hypothetical protein
MDKRGELQSTFGWRTMPKFDVTTWFGAVCTSNTPKPIVDALVDALQIALNGPPLVNSLATALPPMSGARRYKTPRNVSAISTFRVDKSVWTPRDSIGVKSGVRHAIANGSTRTTRSYFTSDHTARLIAFRTR